MASPQLTTSPETLMTITAAFSDQHLYLQDDSVCKCPPNSLSLHNHSRDICQENTSRFTHLKNNRGLLFYSERHQTSIPRNDVHIGRICRIYQCGYQSGGWMQSGFCKIIQYQCSLQQQRRNSPTEAQLYEMNISKPWHIQYNLWVDAANDK